MSRIETAFSKLRQHKRKALIPFITAGDPNPQLTVPLMRALVEAGADRLGCSATRDVLGPPADGPGQ